MKTSFIVIVVVITVIWIIGSYFLYKWYKNKNKSVTPSSSFTNIPLIGNNFGESKQQENVKQQENDYWWKNNENNKSYFLFSGNI